jgi:fatty-acyl-CoA synthase
VPSEFFGEEVAAALRLHPGATIDAEEVKSFCRERLARFKVPHYIRVVDAFPLTASGKIQKFRLREQHETANAGGSLNITASKSPSGA